MSSFCLCYISLSYFGVYLLKNGADRHHNPARLTTASNHLRGSLRQWRDFTMIGVCSFYPFGVVIWQDVSNMSCKRWHGATMHCKGTQKTSIIETFGAT